VANEPLPELDTDPTALALGAAPVLVLDPTSLRGARQSRGLRTSDLAASLRARGWATTTAEAFAWERRAEQVAPALSAELASALDVPTDSLARSEHPATMDSGESDEA